MELKTPIEHPRLPYPKDWVLPQQCGGHSPQKEARSSLGWGAGDPRAWAGGVANEEEEVNRFPFYPSRNRAIPQ